MGRVWKPGAGVEGVDGPAVFPSPAPLWLMLLWGCILVGLGWAWPGDLEQVGLGCPN